MRWILGLAFLLVLAACGSSGGGSPADPGVPVGGVAPDFTLADVNPSSPSGGQPVSPRDELGGVSAWYFGHST